MNQETTQIVADINKTINNPSDIKSIWQAYQLIENIEKLCYMGINQNLFQFDGLTYCTICEEFLSDHSFKQLPCQHNVHIYCFQKAMLTQSESLQVIELQYCCQEQHQCQYEAITEQMLIDFFGEQYISSLRQEQIQKEQSTLYQLPNCQICRDVLGQNFKQLFCGHFVHIDCFLNYMTNESPQLDIEDLRYKYCCSDSDFCRQQIVTDQMLFDFFGKDYVLMIRDKSKQKKEEQYKQALKTQKEEEEKTCCTQCKMKIENEKINKLFCGHAIHKQCFRENMLKQSSGLVLRELRFCCEIEPNCSYYGITEDMLLEYFEKVELNTIREQFLQDQRLIEQLKEQEKQKIKEKEKAFMFDCGVCFSTKPVESDAITLVCEHRFCKECIKENISTLVNQGKFSYKDIVCPQCNKEIEPQIIQYCNPDLFQKINDLRVQNFVLATQQLGEKCVNCPQRGCSGIVIIPDNMKFPICPLCNNKFCANGCETHHEGIDCKDYLIKVKANQKQGDTKCPKCKVPIFKDGGCNHITCKCKHEFCFVCKGPYKPKKTCKCPQNGTADNIFGFLRRLNPFN